MKLFDDMERTDESPMKYQELLFEYMNRSTWQEYSHMRCSLESWFDRYQDSIGRESRNDLCRRFRGNNTNHTGAIFELFIHEFLTRLGCNVEVEPSVSGQQPDFLVHHGDSSFYVEATVVKNKGGEEGNPIALHPDLRYAMDAINDSLSSKDFYIDIDEVGDFPPSFKRPKKEAIVEPFRKLIEESEYCEVRKLEEEDRFGELPYAIFRHKGWCMKGSLLPKDESDRKKSVKIICGGPSVEGNGLRFFTPIRKAVRDKAKKYKDVCKNRLLVVAVNLSASHPALDRNAAQTALYGYSRKRDEAHRDTYFPMHKCDRNPDGVWSHEDKIYNRHLGAVLLFRQIPDHVDDYFNYLYISPHTKDNLPNFLRRLPYAELKEDELVEWHDGENLFEDLPLLSQINAERERKMRAYLAQCDAD